jgi:hypothetical protein
MDDTGGDLSMALWRRLGIGVGESPLILGVGSPNDPRQHVAREP